MEKRLYKFKCPHCGCCQMCVEKVFTRTEVLAANDTMLKEDGKCTIYYRTDGEHITGESEWNSEEVFFCYSCLREFASPETHPELFTEEIQQDAY